MKNKRFRYAESRTSTVRQAEAENDRIKNANDAGKSERRGSRSEPRFGNVTVWLFLRGQCLRYRPRERDINVIKPSGVGVRSPESGKTWWWSISTATSSKDARPSSGHPDPLGASTAPSRGSAAWYTPPGHATVHGRRTGHPRWERPMPIISSLRRPLYGRYDARADDGDYEASRGARTMSGSCLDPLHTPGRTGQELLAPFCISRDAHEVARGQRDGGSEQVAKMGFVTNNQPPDGFGTTPCSSRNISGANTAPRRLLRQKMNHFVKPSAKPNAALSYAEARNGTRQ